MEPLTSFDPHAVERFARDWEDKFDRGDHEAMAAFYDEDARLIATQQPTLEGRAAIGRFWSSACTGARAAGIVRTVHVGEAHATGDLGYMAGEVKLVMPARPETVVRFVTLWRRATDGAWRLYIDISSPRPD